MLARRGPRGPNPDTIAVALLGVAFFVVAGLLGQALLTLRSQDRTVQTALDDFAALGSERIAESLNTTFTTILLDRIAAGKVAHDAWVAGDKAAEVAADPGLPEGAVPVYFSLDGDRVIERSGRLDEATRGWILAEVVGHAEHVYPRPAPYALLRGAGARAIVYRKEEYYGTTSVYGFVLHFDRFAAVYERLLAEAAILPRGLTDDGDPTRLSSVRLFFPQGDHTLFATPSPRSGTVASAVSYASKAGRMGVEVRLDAAAARTLEAGGYPNARLALLIGLAALTFGLLSLAVVLTRRASRLNELREAFVSNASHDLRTPLAQIRMFSETLLLDRITDPAERRRSLEIIRQQATHLGDLVENVLHASDRNGSRIDPAPTDLDGVVASTLDALSPLIATRAATVERHREGPAIASVDTATFRRILTNLVENALKFGPHGQTVSIQVRNQGEQVELSVDDQGPGVPRRERKRIWERFERLDQRHPSTSGTGIGLAVVRDLALGHGGSVRIDDAPTGGARVSITLATGPQPS